MKTYSNVLLSFSFLLLFSFLHRVEMTSFKMIVYGSYRIEKNISIDSNHFSNVQVIRYFYFCLKLQLLATSKRVAIDSTVIFYQWFALFQQSSSPTLPPNLIHKQRLGIPFLFRSGKFSSSLRNQEIVNDSQIISQIENSCIL